MSNLQEKRSLMNPRNDFCFKELMADEYIRRGFIAAVLGCGPDQVAGSVLLPTHLRRSGEEDKLGILDVLARLRDGTLLNMEIQIICYKDWPDRSLFYTGKNLVGQLKKGEPYGKLHKCVHIGILDFCLYPESNEYFTEFYLMDIKEHKRYTEKLEIYTLELPKIKGQWFPESDIWQWGMFLNGEEEEIEMLAKNNPYINEAYEELKRLSADEEKRLEYEAREKAIRDHVSLIYSYTQEGIEQGIEFGEKKLLISMVLGKLRKGKCVPEISEMLEMNPEDVQRIWKKYEDNPDCSDQEIYEQLKNEAFHSIID